MPSILHLGSLCPFVTASSYTPATHTIMLSGPASAFFSAQNGQCSEKLIREEQPSLPGLSNSCWGWPEVLGSSRAVGKPFPPGRRNAFQAQPLQNDLRKMLFSFRGVDRAVHKVCLCGEASETPFRGDTGFVEHIIVSIERPCSVARLGSLRERETL